MTSVQDNAEAILEKLPDAPLNNQTGKQLAYSNVFDVVIPIRSVYNELITEVTFVKNNGYYAFVYSLEDESWSIFECGTFEPPLPDDLVEELRAALHAWRQENTVPVLADRGLIPTVEL